MASIVARAAGPHRNTRDARQVRHMTGSTAGLAWAARLSEDSSLSVLVLEAGGSNLDEKADLIPGKRRAQYNSRNSTGHSRQSIKRIPTIGLTIGHVAKVSVAARRSTSCSGTNLPESTWKVLFIVCIESTDRYRSWMRQHPGSSETTAETGNVPRSTQREQRSSLHPITTRICSRTTFYTAQHQARWTCLS